MPDRNHCSTLFIPGFMAGAGPVLAGGGGAPTHSNCFVFKVGQLKFCTDVLGQDQYFGTKEIRIKSMMTSV